jgi:WD40 repeat protein
MTRSLLALVGCITWMLLIVGCNSVPLATTPLPRSPVAEQRLSASTPVPPPTPTFLQTGILFRPTRILTEPDGFWQIAFSPDGQTLAALEMDSTISLYRTRDFMPIQTFPQVGSFAWSPDSTLLATGDATSDAAWISVWRVADGRLLHRIPLAQDTTESLVFSPDGRSILAVVGRMISAWQVADGSHLWSIEAGTARSIAISPNGTFFAVSTESGIVSVYQFSNQTLVAMLKGQSWGNGSLEFSADGQQLATVDTDGNVSLWTLPQGSLIRRLQRPDERSGAGVLAWSAKEPVLAVSAQNDILLLWNTHTGRLQQVLAASPRGITRLDFSPDGRTLVAAGGQGQLTLWQRSSGE